MPFPSLSFKLRDSVIRMLRSRQRLLLLGITTVLSLSTMHCNSSDTPAGPVGSADSIKIISPAAGEKVKLTDTNLIILQIDTNLFNRTGLYLSFSLDSGKCWAVDCLHGGTLPAYRVKPGKGAVRLDTIKWVPADYPYTAAGMNVKLKIIDYPPVTITRMVDFSFSN